MRTFHSFPVSDIEAFILQLLEVSNKVKHFCYLDSNNYPNYPYSTFGSLFAIGAIDVISVDKDCLAQFDSFRQKHQDWMFGFLNYDLKNEIEPALTSGNIDHIQNPLLHFFVPKYLLKIENGLVEIGIHEEGLLHEFQQLLESVNNRTNAMRISDYKIKNRISKHEYIKSVEKIKTHIQLGDIYELNFCQEFYAGDALIDTVRVFQKLNQLSKAPFTSFFKNEGNYLMCASPERFLKRQNNTLISQPIKGTRKRIQDKKQDNLLKQQLFFDEKERSENVMIVDLVRNDFSRIALKNSVEVEELFGIYSFEQVHQMISTVTCTIPQDLSFSEIIKAVFPMGSMTGAPKIAAMELIEQYEPTKRGLFSGAVGYMTPKGNFDFNVVIRSILYNEQNQYVSIQAGSAITIDCDAEKEYEECLLKAKAMLEALG
ncbi:MAG: anthranilate synthase component I family protein [Sphingobacteriales bacterium]|nr:anthranilate synthase component I family protein [Sphingobacteriales bacterium]